MSRPPRSATTDPARTGAARSGRARGAVAPDRKRGSGAKILYDTLRDEIIDRSLPRGGPMDEIPPAERFSLSRTPIRAALVWLSSQGLVTTLPNRSTVVSNIGFLALPAFFDAISLMYRVTTRAAAEPAALLSFV